MHGLSGCLGARRVRERVVVLMGDCCYRHRRWCSGLRGVRGVGVAVRIGVLRVNRVLLRVLLGIEGWIKGVQH